MCDWLANKDPIWNEMLLYLNPSLKHDFRYVIRLSISSVIGLSLFGATFFISW